MKYIQFGMLSPDEIVSTSLYFSLLMLLAKYGRMQGGTPRRHGERVTTFWGINGFAHGFFSAHEMHNLRWTGGMPWPLWVYRTYEAHVPLWVAQCGVQSIALCLFPLFQASN